jgi:methyl-accepting chemotaxis protein
MVMLNLKGAAEQVSEVKVGFRSGWFRNVGVVIGGASGTALVLSAFEVLRSEPTKAFALLQNWGPAFLIAMLAIFVLGKFLDGLNQTVRESFTLMAGGVSAQAEAAGRTADALTRLAEQGGKQAQEVQRLAIYAAQEFPSVYERLDRQDVVLDKINQTIGDLAKAVMTLTVRGEK